MDNYNRNIDIEQQLILPPDKQSQPKNHSTFRFGIKLYASAALSIFAIGVVGNEMFTFSQAKMLSKNSQNLNIKSDQFRTENHIINLVESNDNTGKNDIKPVEQSSFGFWSFFSCFIGFFLVSMALPFAWFNEKKNVQLCALIHKGEQECIENISVEVADPNLNFKLVHCIGQLTSQDVITDDNVGICLDNTLYLKRTVQCFQTEQLVDEEGYPSYIKNWCDVKVPSEKFFQKQQIQNPTSWPFESMTTFNPNVKLGCFSINDTLKERFSAYESIDLRNQLTDNILQKNLPFLENNQYQPLVQMNDGWYMTRQGDSQYVPGQDPQIGDFRIKWEQASIPAKPVTVVAQQIIMPDNTTYTFRGWNPLKIEDVDNSDDLNMTTSKYCITCNWVERFLARVQKELLQIIVTGSMSQKEVLQLQFGKFEQQAGCLRVFSFIFNVIGHIFLLLPLMKFLTWIPLVLSMSKLWSGLALIVFATICATILYFLLMTIAYIYWRPKLGAIFLLISGICIGLLFI